MVHSFEGNRSLGQRLKAGVAPEVREGLARPAIRGEARRHDHGGSRERLAGLEAQKRELRARMSAQGEQIGRLVSLGENLKSQLAELKARLGINSPNSSKPPASDGPEAPLRPSKKPTGQARGGQNRPAGHARALAPVDLLPTYPLFGDPALQLRITDRPDYRLHGSSLLRYPGP